jgi:hypothetical protein
MGLGIMILDDVYPGLPGDVRNASAYPFPIQYEIVEGIDIQALCYADDKTPCLEPLLRAARKLERMGCRAIAGECGFFSYFQREIAGAVDVPVFMSSLLQVPLAQQLIGPDKIVSIITADAHLSPDHLKPVGIDMESNFEVMDMSDHMSGMEFEKLWSGSYGSPENPSLRYSVAESQIVEVIGQYVGNDSHIGSLVLECTGYQPFARAIQRVVDMPVYSWGTLLDYAYSVTVHRDYYGHV